SRYSDKAACAGRVAGPCRRPTGPQASGSFPGRSTVPPPCPRSSPMTPRTETTCPARPAAGRVVSRVRPLWLLAVCLAGCAARPPCLHAHITDAAVLARLTMPPEAAQQLEGLVTGRTGPPAPAQEAAAVPVEAACDGADVPVFSLPQAIDFALANSPRLRASA